MQAREIFPDTGDESGFTLAEFLLASSILLIISASVFTMLGQTQRAASFQTEVQGVLDNTRIAMDTIEHVVRQAGNDPRSAGFEGLTIVGSDLRVRSDLTGSAGPTYPDKGDPDGDTTDSGEDVTIHFNSTNGTIEVTPNGASAQPIASYISGFSMQFFDAAGASTTVGSAIRRVAVTITGRSRVPDPQTGEFFSTQLRSDVQIANRQ